MPTGRPRIRRGHTEPTRLRSRTPPAGSGPAPLTAQCGGRRGCGEGRAEGGQAQHGSVRSSAGEKRRGTPRGSLQTRQVTRAARGHLAGGSAGSTRPASRHFEGGGRKAPGPRLQPSGPTSRRSWSRYRRARDGRRRRLGLTRPPQPLWRPPRPFPPLVRQSPGTSRPARPIGNFRNGALRVAPLGCARRQFPPSRETLSATVKRAASASSACATAAVVGRLPLLPLVQRSGGRAGRGSV